MLGKKIKSPLSRIAEVIVLLLAFAPVGICQTTAADHNEPVSSETVEEITVYGDKSLIRLRHEMYAAAENFFAIFNEINSNDDFDVECEYVTFLGSRRRHYLCMPRFAEKAEAQATLEMISSDSWYHSPMDLKRIKTKEEFMWREMADLLSTHSELQDAMTKLTRSKLVYETERKSRKDD